MTSRLNRRGSLATYWSALSLLGLSACATSYTPVRSPRISVTFEHGTFAYVRDGQRFEGGLFGEGLSDAVHGNARAEHEAKLFTRKMGWGLGGVLGGLAIAVTGAAILPVENRHVVWNAQAYTGLSLAAIGLAAYTTGLVLMVSAAPHQWDAINIYNDDADARLRAQFAAQRFAVPPGYQLVPVMPTLQPPALVAPGAYAPAPNEQTPAPNSDNK